MTTRVNFSHNIESVIADIDDVEDDLRHEFRKRVGAAMRVLWADAKQYVLNDPHNSGDLFRSIKNDSDTTGSELSFRVYTDARIAAHAAIVEYGSGDNSNVPYDSSAPVPPGTEDSVPPGYPFDSPDTNVPFLASVIEEWMMRKPIQSEKETIEESAWAIALSIIDNGTYAHPFLRPAWFDNELKIKKAARNAVRNAVR